MDIHDIFIYPQALFTIMDKDKHKNKKIIKSVTKLRSQTRAKYLTVDTS